MSSISSLIELEQPNIHMPLMQEYAQKAQSLFQELDDEDKNDVMKTVDTDIDANKPDAFVKGLHAALCTILMDRDVVEGDKAPFRVANEDHAIFDAIKKAIFNDDGLRLMLHAAKICGNGSKGDNVYNLFAAIPVATEILRRKKKAISVVAYFVLHELGYSLVKLPKQPKVTASNEPSRKRKLNHESSVHDIIDSRCCELGELGTKAIEVLTRTIKDIEKSGEHNDETKGELWTTSAACKRIMKQAIESIDENLGKLGRLIAPPARAPAATDTDTD